MDDKKNRELIGIICIFLGGAFILAGLVFFVVNNRNNIYGKKVSATVMSSVAVTTSDGKKMTLLEVMYPVAGENITTTYDYPGELEEGEVFLTLYYDARNPKLIINAGWTFEALFLALLGGVIFLLGLYYKGITDFGIVEMKKPDANAPERVKKTYEARERIANGLFPSLGGLVFIAFGLVMVFTRHNYWMWFFVGIGALVILYFSLIMVPAMIELHQLKVAKKFRGTVVDRSDTDLKKESEKDDSGQNDSEQSETDDLEAEASDKKKDQSKKEDFEKEDSEKSDE